MSSSSSSSSKAKKAKKERKSVFEMLAEVDEQERKAVAASSSSASASSSSQSPTKKRRLKKKTDDDDDDATISTVAQSAVTIKLIGHQQPPQEFHPTFTHQIFANDSIRGYGNARITMTFRETDMMYDVDTAYDTEDDAVADDLRQVWCDKLQLTPTKLHNNNEEYKLHGTQCGAYDDQQNGYEYVMHVGKLDDPAVRAFHDRVRPLAILFIENASYPQGDYDEWEMVSLHRRRRGGGGGGGGGDGDQPWVFVGYMTLFNFYVFPDGHRFRLSQMVILPPYQRQGHGTRLLECAYELAKERKYAEVNVEDPSPEMQFMRDKCDLALVHANASSVPRKWDAKWAQTQSRRLHIRVDQVRRCYEMLRWKELRQLHDDASMKKAFRLEVKARLYKEHQEELGVPVKLQGDVQVVVDTAVEDTPGKVAERKRRLAELFTQTCDYYDQVLNKTQLPQ